MDIISTGANTTNHKGLFFFLASYTQSKRIELEEGVG